jgi:hypothetical protein
MKGSLIYLGAEPAKQAALRVERFMKGGDGQAEAEEAVRALQRQCEVLKTALTLHQSARGGSQSESSRRR